MGSVQIEKFKAKNWQIGDTFAIKIKNKNPFYNGKYLILIKGNYYWNDDNRYSQTFLLKITKDDKLPLSLEEINSLEFIKTGYIHFIERFSSRSVGMENYDMVLERCKNLKFYPDEYNYLYMYDTAYWIDNRRKYDNLIYLGNYDIDYPQDEFPPVCFTYRKSVVEMDDLVEDAINKYEDFNLKKSKIYNEDREKVEQRAKLYSKIHQEVLNDTYKP